MAIFGVHYPNGVSCEKKVPALTPNAGTWPGLPFASLPHTIKRNIVILINAMPENFRRFNHDAGGLINPSASLLNAHLIGMKLDVVNSRLA